MISCTWNSRKALKKIVTAYNALTGTKADCEFTSAIAIDFVADRNDIYRNSSRIAFCYLATFTTLTPTCRYSANARSLSGPPV
jgi:hypothetical protein